MTSKAVIVTGATGFIGSWLVKSLLKKEYKVAVITRKESSLERLSNHKNIILVPGNLNDVSGWYKQLSNLDLNFRCFFHLAWDGVSNLERNSIQQMNNVLYSLETLRLAKSLNCTKWIGTGSQAEYGPLNKKIKETDVAHPTTMYGVAKLATCNSSQILAREIGIEAVWVRVFSTYGPYDNSGWLLTDTIKTMLDNKTPALTLGEQLWDYLYVEDAAEALVNLSESNTASGVYNLGSGQSLPIRSIMEQARNLINPNLSLGFGQIPYRQDQVMHLEADIERITKDTSWRPRTELRVGLGNLINSLKKIIGVEYQ